MSEYRRFIAYVYEYQKGKKAGNCGFVKVECRDARCRIEMHLNCVGIPPQMEFRTYGFFREDELMNGILLGKCRSQAEQMECVIEADANNLAKSGIGFDQIGGIVVLTEAGGFLGTEWDDQPIRPDTFRETHPRFPEDLETPIVPETPMELPQPEEPAMNERNEVPNQPVTPEQPVSPERPVTPEQPMPPERPVNPEQPMPPERPVNPEFAPPETTFPENGEDFETSIIPETPMELQQPEGNAMSEEISDSPEPPAAPKTIPHPSEVSAAPVTTAPAAPARSAPPVNAAVSSAPKEKAPTTVEASSAAPARQLYSVPGEEFTPFDDVDFLHCWKIHPNDLARCASNVRNLRNNRFLQYGFYNFGHLLLGVRPGNKFILGVPGGYDQQERFMANMFGFPWFRESRAIQLPRNRGGYWYRSIDAPNFH